MGPPSGSAWRRAPVTRGPRGVVFNVAEGHIDARPFDTNLLAIAGDPVRLDLPTGGNTPHHAAMLSVSANTLVHVAAPMPYGSRLMSISRFGSDLRQDPLAGMVNWPRLSPDGSRRFGGEMTAGELMGIGFIADGRDEVLTATREDLRAGASQIKVMAGGGAASAYDPLDVAQYTLDEMKAAVEAADDWGTYVTVHAYIPKAVRRAIEAGVRCIEHGQLLDEATMQLLGAKGIWLSLQALDEAPPTAPADTRAKKHTVVEGTDNAFKWARKYNVKLAWGTDFMFSPAQNRNQNADILKLKQWMKPAEVLKLVTHDNAQLLALSGPRNPYPGKLGVVEEGALADLLLLDGNPIANMDVIASPEKNVVVIMKDGKVYKNTIR